MWIIWKIPPTKAQTPPRSCLVFMQSVLHYWPIAAKPTSAVPNDSAVRRVQFQEISSTENWNTLDKELSSPRTQLSITYWSPDRQTLCGTTYEFKATVTKQYILQHLQCRYILNRLFFNVLYHFLDWIKEKNWKILKNKIFIRVFYFPRNYTELNISQFYDCSLQLLFVTWTVGQCSTCTHILNTGRIHSIFLSLSLKHIGTRYSVSIHYVYLYLFHYRTDLLYYFSTSFINL